MDDLIEQLRRGCALGSGDVKRAVACLGDPKETEARKADLLRALHDKGETPEEIAAFTLALLERAVDPGIDPGAQRGPLLDMCGTGGDRLDLFNVSTTAMFLVAAAGAAIVKHGNRKISSRCGGADVLEALRIRIDLEPADARRCLDRCGIVFLFARKYHPTFQIIAPVRARLASEGGLTIFNQIGPLLNPARPPHQVVGVFSRTLLEPTARALGILGRTHAWAVHGETGDGRGMDELSILGRSFIAKVRGRATGWEEIDPAQLAFRSAALDQVAGGDATRNAATLVGILRGAIQDGRRDMAVFNAAAGLVVAGLARDLAHGIDIAQTQIASGNALKKLEALRAFK